MNRTWKIAIYLLGFGFLTLIAALFGAPTRKEYTPGEVAGAKTNLSVFIQPVAKEKPITDAISQAKKEVLVEVYLLSDNEILESLERAYERGVVIKVMVEEHPFGGGNINKVSAERLQKAGIQFKFTNPTFALTHQKSIIVDNNTLFVLNQNLTESAFRRNREFDIVDTNPGHVEEAVKIFEADWDRTRYNPTQEDLIVSPVNSRDKLKALLMSAKQKIDIEMEVIQDDEIVEILSEKSQSVPVRIIIPDLKKLSSNKEDVSKLLKAGVQVKTLSNPYMHAKLITVDEAKGYAGSINFTSASMDLNRELGILFSQDDVVFDVQKVFNDDWQNASELDKI